MKGGRALPPNYNQEEMEIEEQTYVPEIQPPNMDTLAELGFEEGELEMLFDTMGNTIDENELFNRYLDIARQQPYNQTWQNIDNAISADYELDATKPNGRHYTKHDIVQDTLNSYYDDVTGGKRRKLKKSRRKHKKNNKKKYTHKRKQRKSRSKSKSRSRR